MATLSRKMRTEVDFTEKQVTQLLAYINGWLEQPITVQEFSEFNVSELSEALQTIEVERPDLKMPNVISELGPDHEVTKMLDIFSEKKVVALNKTANLNRVAGYLRSAQRLLRDVGYPNTDPILHNLGEYESILQKRAKDGYNPSVSNGLPRMHKPKAKIGKDSIIPEQPVPSTDSSGRKHTTRAAKVGSVSNSNQKVTDKLAGTVEVPANYRRILKAKLREMKLYHRGETHILENRLTEAGVDVPALTGIPLVGKGAVTTEKKTPFNGKSTQPKAAKPAKKQEETSEEGTPKPKLGDTIITSKGEGMVVAVDTEGCVVKLKAGGIHRQEFEELTLQQGDVACAVSGEEVNSVVDGSGGEQQVFSDDQAAADNARIDAETRELNALEEAERQAEEASEESLGTQGEGQHEEYAPVDGEEIDYTALPDDQVAGGDADEARVNVQDMERLAKDMYKNSGSIAKLQKVCASNGISFSPIEGKMALCRKLVAKGVTKV